MTHVATPTKAIVLDIELSATQRTSDAYRVKLNSRGKFGGCFYGLTLDIPQKEVAYIDFNAGFVVPLQFGEHVFGVSVVPLDWINRGHPLLPAWCKEFIEVEQKDGKGNVLPKRTRPQEETYARYARISRPSDPSIKMFEPRLNERTVKVVQSRCRKCRGKAVPYTNDRLLCLSHECGFVDAGQELCPVCSVETEKVWTLKYGVTSGCHIHGAIKSLIPRQVAPQPSPRSEALSQMEHQKKDSTTERQVDTTGPHPTPLFHWA